MCVCVCVLCPVYTCLYALRTHYTLYTQTQIHVETQPSCPYDSALEAGAPSRGKLQGLALQGSTLCFSLRPGLCTLGLLVSGHLQVGKPAAL